MNDGCVKKTTMMDSSEYSDTSSAQEHCVGSNHQARKATTYNRRARLHLADRRATKLIAFLKRRVLNLVSKNNESKLHPPSNAMKTQQDTDTQSGPSPRYSYLGANALQAVEKLASTDLRYLSVLAALFLFVFFNMNGMNSVSRIQSITYASVYKTVPQFVVVSPDIGYLDVIGTTHHLCGDDENNSNEKEYTTTDFSLSIGPQNTMFSASSINDPTSQAMGSLVVARFRVGRRNWKAMFGSDNTGTSTLSLWDKKQDMEFHDLPLWVDPTLSQYYSNHPLPTPPEKKASEQVATTSSMKPLSDSKNFLGVALSLRSGESSSSCDNQCLHNRIRFWLAHHRDQGVDQFYILHNVGMDAEVEPVGLLGHETAGVTYIRTQIPDQDITCQHHVAFPGEKLLQNAILKAANVEWLVLLKLDELLIARGESGNLKSLIHSALKVNNDKEISAENVQIDAAAVRSLHFPSFCACCTGNKSQPFDCNSNPSIDLSKLSTGLVRPDIQVMRTSLISSIHRGTAISSVSNAFVRLDPQSQGLVVQLDFDSPDCGALATPNHANFW